MGYGGFPKAGIPQITQGIRPSLVDTLEDHLYLNVRWNPKDGWIWLFFESHVQICGLQMKG